MSTLWICTCWFLWGTFYVDGKLDVSIFQKEENKYMYIPAKSGHQKHTINPNIHKRGARGMGAPAPLVRVINLMTWKLF